MSSMMFDPQWRRSNHQRNRSKRRLPNSTLKQTLCRRSCPKQLRPCLTKTPSLSRSNESWRLFASQQRSQNFLHNRSNTRKSPNSDPRRKLYGRSWPRQPCPCPKNTPLLRCSNLSWKLFALQRRSRDPLWNRRRVSALRQIVASNNWNESWRQCTQR